MEIGEINFKVGLGFICKLIFKLCKLVFKFCKNIVVSK